MRYFVYSSTVSLCQLLCTRTSKHVKRSFNGIRYSFSATIYYFRADTDIDCEFMRRWRVDDGNGSVEIKCNEDYFVSCNESALHTLYTVCHFSFQTPCPLSVSRCQLIISIAGWFQEHFINWWRDVCAVVSTRTDCQVNRSWRFDQRMDEPVSHLLLPRHFSTPTRFPARFFSSFFFWIFDPKFSVRPLDRAWIYLI